MFRPSPLPFSPRVPRVVTSSSVWRIDWICASVMPWPLSQTKAETVEPLRLTTRRISLPDSENLSALFTRLRRTVWTIWRSARTVHGSSEKSVRSVISLFSADMM